MSSAAQVGQSIQAAGTGARLTKLDMKDAYKLVLAKPQDYRLQGFEWQGQYFVDTQQAFGATTAAANFDKLASTTLCIVKSEMNAPQLKIHRTLDDVVSVAQARSPLSKRFTTVYWRTAAALNIKLAEDCSDNDKVFTDQTWGTILGIVFDTEIMSWRMPPRKVQDLLTAAGNFIAAGMVSLEETQKLAGRINHLTQMLPFLRVFRLPLNDLLAKIDKVHFT
jgi:hypothetical protein